MLTPEFGKEVGEDEETELTIRFTPEQRAVLLDAVELVGSFFQGSLNTVMNRLANSPPGQLVTVIGSTQFLMDMLKEEITKV